MARIYIKKGFKNFLIILCIAAITVGLYYGSQFINPETKEKAKKVLQELKEKTSPKSEASTVEADTIQS